MCGAASSVSVLGTRRSVERRRVWHARRRVGRGFVIVEFLGFLALTLALLVLLTLLIVQYAQVRRELDTRRQLYLAAETALQRMRAGISSVDSEPAAEETPLRAGQTEVQITTTPGKEAWADMTHVQVVARKRISSRRIVEVELSGYVPSASGAVP